MKKLGDTICLPAGTNKFSFAPSGAIRHGGLSRLR